MTPKRRGQMASYIARRKFLAALGGAAAAWPLSARVQQPAMPVIGWLGGGRTARQRAWVDAFVRRMGELGWIEGRTIAIEYRWGEGRAERYAEIAAEFVRLKPDVIVGAGDIEHPDRLSDGGRSDRQRPGCLTGTTRRQR